MANTYYKYTKLSHLTDDHHMPVRPRDVYSGICLQAIGHANDIRMGLLTDNDIMNVDITEQEQNDLIRGIMERRQVPYHIVNQCIEEMSKEWRGDNIPDISADNQEQSKIHPANK